MCLGIPMRIKRIKGRFAEVESGGILRTVNIELIPSAKVGDYCLIHAGFAIQRIDPEEAKRTLRLLNEIH
ncbi:MAG: HypC/HybG/HupF family hydrogenase formation chaperone [Candidatus Omnitrophica bacterium]|nr:HypC/HybG/HupF family hydrogenase formation chaperone [Candidatus Omnitrophota bacterium]